VRLTVAIGALASLLLCGALCPLEAGATTICVPSVAAACSGTAGAVGKADLEEALSFEGSDGNPDTVLLAPQTFTENATFEPGIGASSDTFEYTGSDPLVVTGAGVGKSVITSAGTSNIFVFNTSYNNTRALTLRDLTIRIPATFPDGLGAGILLTKDDTLEDVEVVSRNAESDGIVVGGSGSVVRGSTVTAEGGQGSISNGIDAGSAGAMSTVEDSTIRGASWGLVSESKNAQLTARRVSVLGARVYGAAAVGGNLTIENSVLTIDNGIGLYGNAAADPVALIADHMTAVNSGGTEYAALEGVKFGASAGSVTVDVRNSILRGFGAGYRTETPFGPGIGTVALEAVYSNLPTSGTSLGGAATFPVGDIDADPLFAPDFSLRPGSPSIDAADPAPGGLPTDFLGAPRPVDGNGDGVARSDQGAFEYQPPPVPAPVPPAPGAGADTTPPETKILKGPGKGLAPGKAKFVFTSSEAASTFECRLDKRKRRPCASPRRYSRLKPGRHVFRVWATDAAGNEDPSPAARRFTVPAR
jgi:hypothetical protein